MTWQSKVISLEGEQPLAQGTHRMLFNAPFDRALIIKVYRETRPAPRNQWKRMKRGLHRFVPALQNRPLLREYAAYLKLKRQQGVRGEEPPVANWCGLVATNLGLGVVYEKIQLDGQAVGPSVSTLWRSGDLQAYLPLLDDFARRLFDWNIRANDINAGNVVLGVRHGRHQFVLVDGLGDSHLIPIRTWSRRLNERSLHKRLEKVVAGTTIHWDRLARRFVCDGAQSLLDPAPHRNDRRGEQC